MIVPKGNTTNENQENKRKYNKIFKFECMNKQRKNTSSGSIWRNVIFMTLKEGSKAVAKKEG